MREIQCVAYENYNGTMCRVFLDGEDFYMTYTDVGKAIGFDAPYLSVLRICEKHSEVFEGLCFQCDVSNWADVDSGEMLLSSEGIIELCVLADRPEANDFVDFLWGMMEKAKKIMVTHDLDDDGDDDEDCDCDDDERCRDVDCRQYAYGFCGDNCAQPFDLNRLRDEYGEDDEEVDAAIRNAIREAGNIRALSTSADFKKAELFIKMANSNRVSFEQGKMLIKMALAECFGGSIPDSLKDKWTQAEGADFEW